MRGRVQNARRCTLAALSDPFYPPPLPPPSHNNPPCTRSEIGNSPDFDCAASPAASPTLAELEASAFGGGAAWGSSSLRRSQSLAPAPAPAPAQAAMGRSLGGTGGFGRARGGGSSSALGRSFLGASDEIDADLL